MQTLYQPECSVHISIYGNYGAQAPEIVFYEAAALDLSNDDIDVSRVHTWHVTAGVQPPDSTLMPTATHEYHQMHALAVAGVAVATGDNGIGTTGVVWRGRGTVVGRAVQYGSNWYQAGEHYVAQLFHIIALQPKILNLSSFGVPRSADTLLRNQAVEKTMNDYGYVLGRVPGMTIVVAAGNDTTSSLSALQSRAEFNAELIGLLKLRDSSDFRDRIIVVTNVNASGARATTANYFPGVTDVAAPGEQIPVLSDPALGYPDTLSGTSFSAPFVAGLLALEYAMDPSLSPAQAKQLLLDGASFRKGRDGSGTIIAASVLPGTSVYPVDAFNTLSLASARIGGLPLCGATVLFSETATRFRYNATGTERAGPASPGAPAYSGQILGGAVTVAPGGRKIAFVTDTAVVKQTWSASLSNGSWTVGSPANNQHKYYLAEDTMTVTFTSGVNSPKISIMNDTLSRRVSNLDLLTAMGLSGYSVKDLFPRLLVSPNGNWALAWLQASDGAPCGVEKYTQSWISLRGGHSATNISQLVSDCIANTDTGSELPVQTYAAWSDDGDTAYVHSFDASITPTIQKWFLGDSVARKVASPMALAATDYFIIGDMVSKVGFGELQIIAWSAESTPGNCRGDERSFNSPVTVLQSFNLATLNPGAGDCYIKGGGALRGANLRSLLMGGHTAGSRMRLRQ